MNWTFWASKVWLVICWSCISISGYSQCQQLPNSDATGNEVWNCEGDQIILSTDGINLAIGSEVDWYFMPDGTQNPYLGFGSIIGSSEVIGDPCASPPEVLYIMVNPDNTQVGGPGDQCDEFVVIWTGSGGFNTSDILVENLGPGTFTWDSFTEGNDATFSCGITLSPGPVPPNSILIIQSSPNNNVTIDSDVLCASGLPVYIIAYDGTGACTGGYFDNNSPCSSCPVMFSINGTTCQYMFDLNYMPPGSSIDGWGWANTGTGVFADEIPPLDIPTLETGMIEVEDFIWTIPDDFCETVGEGSSHFLVGIPDPPPTAPCMQITTDYFGFSVSCPQVILQGGGDVCAGNCPENPTLLTFDIMTGDVPLTLDLVVTATLFGSFDINDVVVSDGESIQICLDGFFPSFDPGTNTLTIPELAIGLSASIEIVSGVTASGCDVPLDNTEIMVHFIDGPTVSVSPDQTICAGEQVNISGTIGGSAQDFEWTSDGDGVFGNPTALITNYTPGQGDIDNGSVTLTLTATDENGACTPATASLTITIDPSVSIETNTPITLCNTDVANIIASVTGPVVPMMWETTGDGEFDDEFDPLTTYTPGVLDVNNGSVILTYTPIDQDVCIGVNEPLVINFVEAADVDVPGNLEICSDEIANIVIEVEGAFTNINWMVPGDGMLEIVSQFEVNYTPGPNDIDNQFAIVSVTVTSSFPECGLTTYNIPVNISECDCPPFETVPPAEPMCALFGLLDLSSLLEIGGTGNWSITNTPPGINPATLSGTIFSVMDSDPGVYTVTYTLDNPAPGCPATSSEQIIVAPQITALAGPDMTLCGVEDIMIEGSYVPFSNLPLTWQTLGDGTFLDQNALTTIYSQGVSDSTAGGVMLILHVFDSVCGDRRDSVTYFFQPPPFVQFFNDTFAICNESEDGSVLNFINLILDGETNGNWQNFGAPVDISNPSSVDFDGVPAGFYSFGYSTTSAVPPCNDVTFTFIVEVETCLCPILQVNPPGGICNTFSSLPLDAFLVSGAEGTWQIIETPAGANPATVSGSVLNINGADPGDYLLAFTIDSMLPPGCTDSITLPIFIQDAPMLQLTGDTITCYTNAIALTAVPGASATGVVWSTSGSGTFFSPNQLSNIYTPSIFDVASASVTLYAQSVDTFGFCASALDSVQLQIVTPPSTQFSSRQAILCNHPDSVLTINFPGLIVSGDGTGTWINADAAPVDFSDPADVDFEGVPVGTYRFIYTTNTAVAPCTDSAYVFTVILKDCTCPTLLLNTSSLLLCQGEVIQLSTLIQMADPGSWIILDGPAVPWPLINGDQLIVQPDGIGVFELAYVLDDLVPGCPDSAVILLTVEDDPEIQVVNVECDSMAMTYTLIIETTGVALTSDFGNVTMAGVNSYQIADIPLGQSIMVLVSTTGGGCGKFFPVDAPNCDCTLMIEDIADVVSFCPDDTFVLIPFITGAQGFALSTWITPEGIKMQPTLPLTEEGDYIWIVRDESGCIQTDTFSVRFDGPDGVDVDVMPPSCLTSENGVIQLEGITGGITPYSWSIQESSFIPVVSLPVSIHDIDTGMYVLTIMDGAGCSYDTTFTVGLEMGGSISLGPDRTVRLGESLRIEPSVQNISVDSVFWTPAIQGNSVASFNYTPTGDITIVLTVIDTAGCVYVDFLQINILVEETFYVANIFSPNQDQINDVMEVHTNLPPDHLLSFEVYDRWGNMLHRRITGETFAWDGRHDGAFLNPGVYVWKLTYKDENDRTLVKLGDVTLVR